MSDKKIELQRVHPDKSDINVKFVPMYGQYLSSLLKLFSSVRALSNAPFKFTLLTLYPHKLLSRQF